MSKKGKKGLKEKTSDELFLEQLSVVVSARLKKEKWDVEDAETRKMKKKLTKAEKKRLASRRAEELKVAVQQERIRVLEEEKRRQEEERRLAIEKEQRDRIEQSIRLEQLGESCGRIRQLRENWLEAEQRDIELAEWDQYLKCDGLPDPSNCGQMNTYLHLWNNVRENTTAAQARTRTDEVLSLLDTLDDFLECPAVEEKKKKDWLFVRNAFREYQQYNVDCAAYRLLRDIDTHLERLDIPTARYVTQHKAFTVCLWVLVQLPIPAPNPKRPSRPATELAFPEVRTEVVFPGSLNVWGMFVRAMYVNYDHYSYMCRSYDRPPIPAELTLDLNEITKTEWTQKVDTKSVIRAQVVADADAATARIATLAAGGEDIPKALKETAQKKNDFIKVDASSLYVNVEDVMYDKYREKMQTEVDADEINMRKYRILGGVYFLDLFYQPPQPTSMVMSEITLSTLSVPKWLYEVPFKVQYEPPPPPEPGVVRKPEEIEEELKRQEVEYESLVLITLALPSTILWLDVPVVCQWDGEKRRWSTKDVHDVKHNEEKQTVQFRTGRFGPFSMAMFRYNSMPYQAWEVKPTTDGRVILTIMAAVLIIEFSVKNGLVCLSQLQNAPNAALDYLIGVYYKLPKLQRLLKRGGVDVFPDCDAFCYTEGVCEKQWPMENHIYYNMAQCSLNFNFAWSRWNLLAGRRKVVMQMREWAPNDRVKLPSYSMLMVTPLKALLVDCTEVSPTFNEEGVAKMKFYSDLYYLVTGTSSIAMKRKLEKSPPDLVNTVAQLLAVTRIVSFS